MRKGKQQQDGKRLRQKVKQAHFRLMKAPQQQEAADCPVDQRSNDGAAQRQWVGLSHRNMWQFDGESAAVARYRQHIILCRRIEQSMDEPIGESSAIHGQNNIPRQQTGPISIAPARYRVDEAAVHVEDKIQRRSAQLEVNLVPHQQRNDYRQQGKAATQASRPKACLRLHRAHLGWMGLLPIRGGWRTKRLRCGWQRAICRRCC